MSKKVVVVLAVIAVGAIMPFVKKTWNKSAQNIVFSVFKVIGLICAIAVLAFIICQLARPYKEAARLTAVK